MTEELRPIHTERGSRTRNRVASMPFVCALALAPPARALGFRPQDAVRLQLASWQGQVADGRTALGGELDGGDPEAPAPPAERAR